MPPVMPPLSTLSQGLTGSCFLRLHSKYLIYKQIRMRWDSTRVLNGAGNRIRTYDPRITNEKTAAFIIPPEISHLHSTPGETLQIAVFHDVEPQLPITTDCYRYILYLRL